MWAMIEIQPPPFVSLKTLDPRLCAGRWGGLGQYAGRLFCLGT
jgi:hypothetical protein